MSNYTENWATTPWQAPEPLEAVQHLRSLLCPQDQESREQTNVPQKVCSMVGDILESIEEKIKAQCRYKHLVHVEHQRDYGTGRDLVRIWKCVAVDHYTTYGYDNNTCYEGEYYDWQKIDVVNIWIRKTWKTTTSWQLVTKSEEECQLLRARDAEEDNTPPQVPTDMETILQDAIASSASESQEAEDKVREIMSTVRDTFVKDVADFSRPRSRSPRGASSSAANTLQSPFVP